MKLADVGELHVIQRSPGHIEVTRNPDSKNSVTCEVTHTRGRDGVYRWSVRCPDGRRIPVADHMAGIAAATAWLVTEGGDA